LTENNKKSITQFTGDELVEIVSATLTCPICGKECEHQYEVYEHISMEHAPMKKVAS